jgi:hypothetical protein
MSSHLSDVEINVGHLLSYRLHPSRQLGKGKPRPPLDRYSRILQLPARCIFRLQLGPAVSPFNHFSYSFVYLGYYSA